MTRQRLRASLGAGLLLSLLLQACTTRAPRPPQAGEATLSDARARQVVAAWQQQLADFVERSGGDPAALARLPAQRATGTLRPARITFGALDIEASAAERDGFDVQGLLLDALPEAGAEPYVFIVGIVQREGYRPVALVDLRLVALEVRGGRLDWTVGSSDAQALQHYRARLDASLPLRFPADQDRFDRVPCPNALCAEERLSASRWSLAHEEFQHPPAP